MKKQSAIDTILAAADLSKPYDAQAVEQPLYAWWEESGYFKPRDDAQRQPFVIAIPPPNVTGALHTGHGLTNTVEDILIRWHRMLGDPTLWIPGTDHAGIATQNVVEKLLAKDGQTRHDLGRELFVENVWEWKDRYHGRITDQLKRLGTSADWDRERFTLDEGLSHAVRVAFKRLYDDGLIYRGSYLVNWCPRCMSAISDLEVVYRDEPEQGHLWYIRYKLADGDDTEWQLSKDSEARAITIATTRPETLLADTAIAVHPEDERYRDLIGREVLLPALGRRIPIIADEYVDREFGTGALKITPGHDPNDYAVGERHKLPKINMLNTNGTINAAGGPYAGMDRFDARKQIVADLEAAGNLIKVEPHLMKIGRCERCDTIVEPLISTQWFLKSTVLAGPAIAAVREGRTIIVPERFDKIYYHWMENIRDWCISRQLWWGHRIPVWYGPDQTQFVALDEAEAQQQALQHYGQQVKIEQDEDVLDTWFSSGLWPFSTLGWPAETEDFERFYPTSVLETGYDILFFWVARMMMLGIYLTGKEPFHTVYLHGLVRDEQGRKMSKSLGNQVDPLDLMDQYGTDAVRFTFATSSTPGQDFALQPLRLEAARNFANKLWNATRFVIGKLDTLPRTHASLVTAARLAGEEYGLADRWILSRFHMLAGDVQRLLQAFNLGEAGRQIQAFFWDDFADWYIEAAKVQLEGDADQQRRTREVLYTVLDGTLRLLHPFMPYVTEVAWQQLHAGTTIRERSAALIVAPFPERDPGALDPEAERDWMLVQEIVRGIRNIRSERGVEANKWIEAVIAAGDRVTMLQREQAIISRLARVAADKLNIAETIAAKPEQATTLVVGATEVFLPLAGMVDLKEERDRLRKAYERIMADVERRRAKLGNASFTSRAPAAVVDKERQALAEAEASATTLEAQVAALG
ncbi:MAG: valine--tRNA ligase [Herpetosiphonaceae bacterium]|nr:valine--tRNA ligase [Herpetosiphonaceae bacterium]